MAATQSEIERNLARFYELESATRDGRRPRGKRAELTEEAIRYVLPAPGSAVLDVGSGPGVDSRSLVGVGHRVTAIDLALQSAKRSSSHGATGVIGSVVTLPFKAASFDVVWSLSVLMHISDEAIAASLGELARVMRPGAVAVLGTWGGANTTSQVDSEQFGIARHFRQRSDDVWTGLLSTHLGDIERYDSWTDPKFEPGWHYQWAQVRAG